MTPPSEKLPAVDSCVHCRTVTWAGNAACGCAFAHLAVDEDAVDALLLRIGNAPVPVGSPPRQRPASDAKEPIREGG
jgi:hypothetical protein